MRVTARACTVIRSERQLAGREVERHEHGAHRIGLRDHERGRSAGMCVVAGAGDIAESNAPARAQAEERQPHLLSIAFTGDG
jgi:hypothetical protein